MRWLVIGGIVTIGFAGMADAQEAKIVQCQKNADVRTVTVETRPTGCRVLYAKGKSPSREVWHYKTHPEMCQSAAQQFVTKLESMGLACANEP